MGREFRRFAGAFGRGAFDCHDLSVSDAGALRDFHRDVVGWRVDEGAKSDSPDFVMAGSGTGGPIAGICHAPGSNQSLPPV